MTYFNCCHSDDLLGFFALASVVATFPTIPVSVEYISDLWSNAQAVCFDITLKMLLTVATNSNISTSDFRLGMERW